MGWEPSLFDAAHAVRPAPDFEAALYTALGRAIGGPVIELGCGTARVLEALLSAGLDSDGVEYDPAMADAARQRLVVSGHNPQRVTTADMLEVEPRRRYALAILPSNTLGSLTHHQDLRRLFGHLPRLLASDGQVAFDVTQAPGDGVRPDFEATTRVRRNGTDVAAQYWQRVHYDATNHREQIVERFTFDDGTSTEQRHSLAVWSEAVLREAWTAFGFELASPVVDESGAAPSPRSRLMFVRLRRR